MAPENSSASRADAPGEDGAVYQPHEVAGDGAALSLTLRLVWHPPRLGLRAASAESVSAERSTASRFGFAASISSSSSCSMIRSGSLKVRMQHERQPMSGDQPAPPAASPSADPRASP